MRYLYHSPFTKATGAFIKGYKHKENMSVQGNRFIRCIYLIVKYHRQVCKCQHYTTYKVKDLSVLKGNQSMYNDVLKIIYVFLKERSLFQITFLKMGQKTHIQKEGTSYKVSTRKQGSMGKQALMNILNLLLLYLTSLNLLCPHKYIPHQT